MDEKQEYILKRVTKRTNAVVRVFSPNITAKERAQRMNAVRKAAERLLKAVEITHY